MENYDVFQKVVILVLYNAGCNNVLKLFFFFNFQAWNLPPPPKKKFSNIKPVNVFLVPLQQAWNSKHLRFQKWEQPELWRVTS